MKKLALITSVVLSSAGALSAGELQNLRSANAEQKRQINALEKEIDNLYSLLEKEMRNNGKKPASRGTTAPAAVTVAAAGNYVVKGGDTLSKISRDHKVSLGTLMKANKLTGKSVLQIGQKLVIPGKSTAIVATSKTKKVTEAQTLADLPPLPGKTKVVSTVSTGTYKVQPGDTFYAIARKLRVSVSSLKQVNASSDPARLQVGQVINVPGNSKNAEQSTPKRTFVEAKKPAEQKSSKNTIQQTQVAEKKSNQSSLKTISTKQDEPEEMKAITLSSPMTLQELADKYNTTVEAINALNNWPYRPSTKLAKGSEIYLPN